MNQVRHQSPRSIDLFVGRIFESSPLMPLALCISLATILWCILLARRQRSGLDKILTGLLGLIAVCEALRILKDSGFITLPGIPKLAGWADFVIASLSLIAAFILRISSIDRATTKAQLRLVEANEKPADLAKGNAITAPDVRGALDPCPLATIAVDLHGVVTYWNAAAETLTGWTRAEMVGRTLPFSAQGPFINKAGNDIDAVFWTSPIRCTNGSATGSLILAADSSAVHAAGLSHPFGTPVGANL
jgi:PAS domain-containing protein